MENDIIEEAGMYRIVCGNARSVDLYSTWEEVVGICADDQKVWENADTAEEACENSPIDWE